MSSYRTQGRRLALQILYAENLGEGGTVADRIEVAAPKSPEEARQFAEELVVGVLAQKEKLDATLLPLLQHWSPERIHPVERDILRLGLYELAFRPDIPARVVLDEAIDLAKRFGDDEAWRLVNGILDTAAQSRIAAEEDEGSE
jgi:N utilization substance protein B